MFSDQIVRAWKDESYRSSLSDLERAQLPPHPSGSIELTGFQASAERGELYTAQIYCGQHTSHSDCGTVHACSFVIFCM
jgi:mersacidin/lichenicidin family type 2 lantibiotic